MDQPPDDITPTRSYGWLGLSRFAAKTEDHQDKRIAPHNAGELMTVWGLEDKDEYAYVDE